MFNIGNQVKWQCRNSNRSNPKWEASFFLYNGIIIECSDKEIVAEYKRAGRDVNGNDCTYTELMKFRALRNGKWIPKQEKCDDPKGRLYLNINQEEVAK